MKQSTVVLVLLNGKEVVYNIEDWRFNRMIKGRKVYDPVTNTWSTGYWIPVWNGNRIVQYLPVWRT